MMMMVAVRDPYNDDQPLRASLPMGNPERGDLSHYPKSIASLALLSVEQPKARTHADESAAAGFMNNG